MNIKSILVVVIFLAIANYATAQKEITQKELNQHVGYLASDELKGRKPGTPEHYKAAEYIAQELKKSGLKLLGTKGFQFFEVTSGVELNPNNSLIFNGITYSVKNDFMPLSFSQNGTYEGEVVFAGYGFDINEEKLKWNDYQYIDVKGKWVIILQGDPEPSNRNSLFIPYSNTRSKTLTAKDKGALGVIFVSGKIHSEKDELTPLDNPRGLSKASLPAFELKREIADKILASKTINEIEAQINSTSKTISFTCNQTLKATVNVDFTKSKAQNVVAFLEGNDAKLKNEIIVIGAHYDHLGMGGFGSGSRTPDTTAVHNGADDNASGVAGIIELAEKIAGNKKQIKRSLLVIAFDAEEMGLLGSKFYTENPLFELSKVKAMLNFDMIGRLDKDTKKLSIGGTGTSPETETLLNSIINPNNLELSFSKEGFGPSDHAAFYANNIPVFFMSSGAHPDYHTPKDDTQYINFDGMKTIGDYSYELLFSLLNRNESLVFQEAGPKTAQSSSRGLKVTLGIMPAFGESKTSGLGVDAVTPGRPAHKAGMLKGDIIIGINGKEVTNVYDYMNRLQALKLGETISVDIIRNNEKMILLIQL